MFKNILLITLVSFMAINCPPDKKPNNNLGLAAVLLSQQNASGRANGVYISGRLVGADGTTAIAGSTITITARNESSAIARLGVTATAPAGFYQNVISLAGAGGNPQPATLYGSTTAGAPTNTTRDSECGATVVAMYSASITNRVICDSSALDASARAVGVSDALVGAGTVVGTITVGSDGSFTANRLPTIATGNTYTLSVAGRVKTRRLRVAKSGTSTLLDGGNDLILGISATDTNRGTSAATVEGAGTTANPYDFNIVDLQVEVVYSKPFDILTGTISSSRSLSSSRDYLLSGTVIVPSGVTLTIPAGTRIFGAVSPAGALLIKQGGRIDAQGTASSPIVFSSEKAAGSRAGGDWQGIIIQGNGIQTFGGAGVTAIGEGDTGTFGGNNNADNSGTMRYVRIEFAGAPFSPGNERNCLSLMGVGSLTTLEYIQCHRGFDDGFEWWGGAVNMRYLVATGNRDDQFDYTDGYIGTVQYAIGHLFATPTAANDDTSRCVEGDGNSATQCTSATVCANPKFANVTCVGFNAGQNHGDAIFVRRASELQAGTHSHYLIQNFGTNRPTNCSTAAATSVNNIFVNTTTGTNSACLPPPTLEQGVAITNLSDTTPNYVPASANPTTGNVNVNLLINSAASSTFYGALEFGGTNWTTGWTAFPAN